MSRLDAVLFTLLAGAAGVAAFALWRVLSADDAIPRRPIVEAEYGPPLLRIENVRFSEIPGWASADHAAARRVFAKSCERIAREADDAPANPVEALGAGFDNFTLAGVASDWKPACAAAVGREDAREFFERAFTPVRVLSLREPKPEARALRSRLQRTGLFTGYFEPSYPAAAAADERFSAPLLARPKDLVMVDVGAFREELAGQRIAGFVEDGRLLPYPDHAAINAGALTERALVLAYLDPDDLFFLQIQGSGRLIFPDGRVLRVGFDGQNGRPYTAVGKALIERGAIPREKISMQTIRAWLDAAPPDEARALREINQSYVFFRALDGAASDEGPLGAEDLALTAMRSLAVDRRYYAMGLPVFLSFADENARLSGLYIAQDTGGAIRGPVRGDIFVGSGADAGDIAGVLKAQGEMIVLLPRPLAQKLELPQ